MPNDPQPIDPRPLEGLLAELPLAAPREAFRRELRARFLAGAAEPQPVAADDAELERLLRAALAADDRACERKRAARERFLEAAPLGGPAPAPRAVVARGPRPTRRAGERPGRRPSSGPRPLLLVGGLVAAAAAVLVVVLVMRDTGGTAPVHEQLAWALRDPAAAPPELLRTVNAGEEWTHAGEEPFDLAAGERFVVRVQPGARFTAPVLARLPEDAPIRLALSDGELIVRTVRGYTGHPIEVVSPDAAVRITGTAVSVMTGAAGTCVCVSHGTVLARQLDTGLQESVGPEETWFSFKQPHPSFGECYHEAFGHESGLLGDYEPEHQAPLMALEAERLFVEDEEKAAGEGR